MPAPFPNVCYETTRHGRPVVYYRQRGKGVRIRLPDDIGSAEFLKAYANAERKASEILTQRRSESVAPVANRLRETMRGAMNRARRRGMEFTIDEDWCVSRLMQQGKRCALTGIEFSVAGKGMRGRDPFCPSLDRIDCRQGYTPENTRIIILAMNIMLSDWGEGIFQTVAQGYRKVQGLD